VQNVKWSSPPILRLPQVIYYNSGSFPYVSCIGTAAAGVLCVVMTTPGWLSRDLSTLWYWRTGKMIDKLRATDARCSAGSISRFVDVIWRTRRDTKQLRTKQPTKRNVWTVNTYESFQLLGDDKRMLTTGHAHEGPWAHDAFDSRQGRLSPRSDGATSQTAFLLPPFSLGLAPSRACWTQRAVSSCPFSEPRVPNSDS